MESQKINSSEEKPIPTAPTQPAPTPSQTPGQNDSGGEWTVPGRDSFPGVEKPTNGPPNSDSAYRRWL